MTIHPNLIATGTVALIGWCIVGLSMVLFPRLTQHISTRWARLWGHAPNPVPALHGIQTTRLFGLVFIAIGMLFGLPFLLQH